VPVQEVDFSKMLLTPPPSHLLGLDDAWKQAMAALRLGKHVILYGPPGSGKTTLAHALCRAAGESRGCSEADGFGYAPATASSDWSSFDLIGGNTLSGAAMIFRAGIVTRAIERGAWVLLDEVNRANIDRALGPVFSLLAGDSSSAAPLCL
jgi:MoxR-like ATPase